MGDKQKIKNTSNATVIQVKGDFIQEGLSAEEVRSICREVLADELSRHASQGRIVSEERFKTITDKIVERLASVEEDLTHRFEDPAVQMSTYDLIKSCIRVGDERFGDEMVDILMDRLKENERTVNCAVIDEAIQILPKLTETAVAFLAIKVFSTLILPGNKKSFRKVLEKMSPLIEQVSSISKLDIAYLKQVGCCMSHGLSSTNALGEILLKSYDLYFRHSISMDDLNDIFKKHPVEMGEREHTAIRFIFLILHSLEDNGFYYDLLSSRHLEVNVEGHKVSYLQPILDDLKSAMPPYSKDELRAELIGINSAWAPVLDRFSQPDITSLQLNPVGYYIGRKRLGAFIPVDVGLEFFYPERVVADAKESY